MTKNAITYLKKDIDMTQSKAEQLEALYAAHQDFTSSPLYIQGSTNIVFGEGNPNADLLFIGEAPGKEEDKQARPFVGRSGRLLNRALELSGLNREDVYITNIVKCRPPNNRTPYPEEIKTGKETMLDEQINIISPKLICTLGSASLKGIMQEPYKITKVRGTLLHYKGIPLLPTYHPAYVLRNQNEAHKFLEDIKRSTGAFHE
jgi:DNA polymerase